MSAERDLLQRMLDDLDENGLSGDVFYAIMDDARALLATPEEPRPFTRADIERLVAKLPKRSHGYVGIADLRPLSIGRFDFEIVLEDNLIAALLAAAGLEAHDG